MKHLKTYKIFEASSSISILPESEQETGEDIRDICIELEDEGYEIFFGSGNGYHSLFIVRKNVTDMDRASSYERFQYKDVKEVVERLKDYLGDRFFNTWVTEEFGSYITLDNQITSIDDKRFRDGKQSNYSPDDILNNTVKIGWK